MDIHSLNLTQKIVISISASLSIIVLFLHNPFGGYVTEMTNPLYAKGVHKVPCTQAEIRSVKNNIRIVREKGASLSEEAEKTLINNCTTQVAYKISPPFTKLRSSSPIVSWFGYIFNIIQLLVVIGAISSITVFLFKDSEKNS